jgi:hypothetical protein
MPIPDQSVVAGVARDHASPHHFVRVAHTS